MARGWDQVFENNTFFPWYGFILVMLFKDLHYPNSITSVNLKIDASLQNVLC